MSLRTCFYVARLFLDAGLPGPAAHRSAGLFGLQVPILVQRPAVTTKALRPSPPVLTPRAAAARGERVPHGAASPEKTFGPIDAAAAPRARPARPPVAERAPDPATVPVVTQLERGPPVHTTRRVPLEEPQCGFAGLVRCSRHDHRLSPRRRIRGSGSGIRGPGFGVRARLSRVRLRQLSNPESRIPSPSPESRIPSPESQTSVICRLARISEFAWPARLHLYRCCPSSPWRWR